MSEPTLAQRVRTAVKEWSRIGAPPSLLRWISRGVKIEWEADAPPPFRLDNYQIPAEAERWWKEKEEPRMLAIGAIELGKQRSHVSPAFMVPKSTPGEWRLVID